MDTACFKEEVDKELVCSICHKVMMQPVQTPCGHLFCLGCLENAHKEFQSEGKWYPRCPVCEEEYLYDAVQPAPLNLRGRLGLLECKCPYCSFHGILHHVTAHLDTCSEAPVSCSFHSHGCDTVIPRRALAAHEGECEFRPVPCPKGCGFDVPLCKSEGHACVAALKRFTENVEKRRKTLKQKRISQVVKVIEKIYAKRSKLDLYEHRISCLSKLVGKRMTDGVPHEQAKEILSVDMDVSLGVEQARMGSTVRLLPELPEAGEYGEMLTKYLARAGYSMHHVASVGSKEKLESLVPGVRVMRGPQWQYRRQDGGAGSIGTVLRVDGKRLWYTVMWDKTGLVNDYRCGTIIGDDGKPFIVREIVPTDEGYMNPRDCRFDVLSSIDRGTGLTFSDGDKVVGHNGVFDGYGGVGGGMCIVTSHLTTSSSPILSWTVQNVGTNSALEIGVIQQMQVNEPLSLHTGKAIVGFSTPDVVGSLLGYRKEFPKGFSVRVVVDDPHHVVVFSIYDTERKLVDQFAHRITSPKERSSAKCLAISLWPGSAVRRVE
eukprot:TRINITY_DN81587_c0_g1_i1.p1 TRINITY_DN81587_c0_g1~~TRINITY_DN81587_c0_g1_i1.p1  ORF type:complete len:545 (+),score=115.95 TRINITY_DN81587_c0_g1_i1:129-1763(+)